MEDPSPLAPTLQLAPIEFRSLDPRIIQVWRIAGLIFCGVILLGSLIGVLIVGLKQPVTRPWIFIGWVVIASLLLWLCLTIPPRRYRNWGYRIDDKVLETRSGKMFQVTRLLPLNRLQHVDLQRGPLERMFGLARLQLHTAGTHESTITIPGLAAEDAAQLRDQLVARGGEDAN
jgi:membrane protein YdbS with pleckstrin-like domain